MNNIKLLPRMYRYLGLILIVPPILMIFINPESIFGEQPESFKFNVFAFVHQAPIFSGESDTFFGFAKTNLFNELLLTLMLIGSWMIAFARIKGEDEFSQQLRLEAMVSAIVWNSVLLLVSSILIHGTYYLYVMISQLFSFLLIFSIIFALKIRKQGKNLSHEE